MKRIRYCKMCLLPDTKPYIEFDAEGICNACISHEKKKNIKKGINWEDRKKEFEEIIEWAKKQNAPFYDILVPVSGGKDSIAQIDRASQYGLRVLAINVDYGIKTEIGKQNLDVVANMGANLLIYRPEQGLHKRLIKIGLEEYGDPDLLSHTLLHAYPLWAALRFNVPLVLLGENSAFEYGGREDLAAKNYITREWFANYAANKGYDARFISKKHNIPFEKLELYGYPNELENSDTKAIFMSYYFYWDSEKHLKIAKRHGFKNLDVNREGTYRNYVGIDEKINRIHQYIKVLKFGYGRATDHACEDIKNARLTRDEAKDLVRRYDLQDLSDYYVNDFIKYLGYSRNELYEILEKFINRDIWDKAKNGKWFIPYHLED